MEVRPFDLWAAARVLTRDVTGVRKGLDRLRAAADAIALNPADPGLRRNLPIRQVGTLEALADSTAGLAAVARELDSAADDAAAAHGPIGQAPICRLPEEIRSTLDHRLTDTVGYGLSALATGAAGVAGSILPPAARPTSGDPGGRFSSRRVPFAVSGVDNVGSGSLPPATHLVVGALDATADQTVLAHDEFGLVDHGGNRFTVVLPGVTDLSRPQQGWNPVHRSPRDFDMAAVPSSRSVDVDANVYAESVAAALAAVEVPVGAELVIVGHSFGADTALDLAADPAFTRRYDLTHVVATGYFSQPQVPSVSAGTEVLVVQNRLDVIVHLGSVMPTAETGVLACEPTGSNSTANISIVQFNGGLGGLGHSVDGYRSVFTGRADLDSGDVAAVGDHLASMDHTSAPPATMLAIDISLPEQPILTPAATLGPGE